ncbi:hypothetical protein LX16_1583 [Stackebrandtia albiflava]|uniref:Uncharacterized protein n=2 Tax=Stackebrandtia albiflava TaxID=406432 RepID=A0A562VDC8_9ACTN|nr:hypothetical protein LX16_1583 [Stackebrandtia albiflava]
MDSWPEPDEAGDDGTGFDAFDEPGFDDDTLDLSDPADDFDDDPAADDEPGDDTPQDTPDDTGPPGDDFDTTPDPVTGTDPDAVDFADGDAFTPDFPPQLELDPMPEPVDGPPWSDADLLGDTVDTFTWNTLDTTAVTDDLLSMDASTGDWNSLLQSDDPAVAGLARWWQP